jgi:hypothetical protein
VSFGTRDGDRIRELAFGIGSGLKGATDSAQRGGIDDRVDVGLVCLEAGGELVGLVEDLGNSARHWHRLWGGTSRCWAHNRVQVSAHDPLALVQRDVLRQPGRDHHDVVHHDVDASEPFQCQVARAIEILKRAQADLSSAS